MLEIAFLLQWGRERCSFREISIEGACLGEACCASIYACLKQCVDSTITSFLGCSGCETAGDGVLIHEATGCYKYLHIILSACGLESASF